MKLWKRKSNLLDFDYSSYAFKLSWIKMLTCTLTDPTPIACFISNKPEYSYCGILGCSFECNIHFFHFTQVSISREKHFKKNCRFHNVVNVRFSRSWDGLGVCFKTCGKPMNVIYPHGNSLWKLITNTGVETYPARVGTALFLPQAKFAYDSVIWCPKTKPDWGMLSTLFFLSFSLPAQW